MSYLEKGLKSARVSVRSDAAEYMLAGYFAALYELKDAHMIPDYATVPADAPEAGFIKRVTEYAVLASEELFK